MNDGWKWPGDALAAISFTYDDGVDSALDSAMPDLEKAGFRGSFYLPVGNPDVPRRKGDWRDAFLRGHEIGSHTVRHPCRGPEHEYNLSTYTPLRIRNEILSASTWLNRHIGSDPFRTFAYPCGQTAIGDPPDEASYTAAVRASHFAARMARGGINNPAVVSRNLLRIASSAIDYPHARELSPFIRYCEQAADSRGWGVLLFHGIGDDWLPTERDVHQGIIDYLADGRFWVAPVREVARYIVEVM